MKSFLFSIHLCIWIGVMTIMGTSATFSFRSSSLLTFVGGGRWINLHQPKRSHTQLPVQFDTLKNSFTQSLRSMSVVEDLDGAAHLDLKVEDSADNFLWTPELDAKLLSELKRLKKLRWYKVAKLMGEGATARNCHDRWRELVWPENLHSYKAPQTTVETISDGWEDEEVSKLVSAVDNNTNKEGTVEWSKVAAAMGFEASVCEDKYNKLLAEEAASTEVESEKMFGLVGEEATASNRADYSGSEVEYE